MDLKEMGWGTVGWINLAQDRNILRVLVNRRRSFGFHKERDTAWLVAKLSASQTARYWGLPTWPLPSYSPSWDADTSSTGQDNARTLPYPLTPSYGPTARRQRWTGLHPPAVRACGLDLFGSQWPK